MLMPFIALLSQSWTAIEAGRTADTAAFTLVYDVTVRGDTVYILHEADQKQILALTSSGRPVTTFGRNGQGPGEFTSPAWMGWKGDTLWVLDMPNRVHRFSSKGRFLRSESATAGMPVRAPSAEGGFLVVEQIQPLPAQPRPDGERESQALSHWVRGNKRRLANLDTYIRPLRIKVRINGQPGLLHQRQPYMDDPFWVMDREGRYIWIVHRRVRQKPPHEFELIKVTVAGDTVVSRRYPYRPRAIDDRDWDRKVAELERTILTQSVRHRLVVDRSELARLMYRPAHVAPVEQALVGRDDTLWLRYGSLPGEPAIWQAVSSSGDLLGTIRLPPAARLMEADAQRIWTTIQNEDGVPSVVWYRLKR